MIQKIRTVSVAPQSIHYSRTAPRGSGSVLMRFLDMFDPATDKFTHFSGPGTAGIDSLVLDVRQDRKGMLWVSSYQGLYRVDPATWQTVHYRHEPDDPVQPQQQSTQVDPRREGRDILGRNGGRTRPLRPRHGKSDATHFADERSETAENIPFPGPRGDYLGPFFLEERPGSGRSSSKQSYSIFVQ